MTKNNEKQSSKLNNLKENEMHVNIPAPESRAPVLYARLKEANHKWIHDEARRNGFKSTSEFTDALIESLRTGLPVTGETTKKAKKSAGSYKK